MELKLLDWKGTWLVGKKTVVQQGKTAAAFVRSFRTGADNARLQADENRVSPKGDIAIWMGDYDSETKSFTEIPGVLVKAGYAPQGDDTLRKLPDCTMGVCIITGSTRDITRGAHNKLLKLLKAAGYLPDYSYGFSMEYYSYEKFEQATGEFTFAYLLPCKKQG